MLAKETDIFIQIMAFNISLNALIELMNSYLYLVFQRTRPNLPQKL